MPATRARARGARSSIEEAAATLLQAYRDAEAELRSLLAELAERIALDPRSTARFREQQTQAILTRIALLRDELEGGASTFVTESLARIYADGMAANGGSFDPEASGSASFSAIHREALEMIAADTYSDLAAATRYLEEHARTVIREATRARVAVGAATGASVGRDVAGLVRTLEQRGVTAFVDAAGRGWSLSTYAEMVIRTKSAVAYNTGTVLRAEEEGTLVFEIRDGERSRHEECLAYNGQTCTAKWALEHPIQHPNCVRSFGPLPLGGAGDVQHGDPNDASAMDDVRAEAARRAGEAQPESPADAPAPEPIRDFYDVPAWDREGLREPNRADIAALDAAWPYRPGEARIANEETAAGFYPEDPGWEDDLDSDDRLYIENYTTSSGYRQVNAELRRRYLEGGFGGTYAPSGNPYLDENLETLQSLADTPLPEATMVWRSVEGRNVPHGESLTWATGRYPVGGEVQLAGMVSTSTDPRVALGFAGDRPDPIIFEIRATRGAPLANVSSLPEEMEVLLPHGSRYRAIGVSEERFVSPGVGSTVETRATVIRLAQISEPPPDV